MVTAGLVQFAALFWPLSVLKHNFDNHIRPLLPYLPIRFGDEPLINISATTCSGKYPHGVNISLPWSFMSSRPFGALSFNSSCLYSVITVTTLSFVSRISSKENTFGDIPYQDVTRLPHNAMWTRKPLAYRESNNFYSCIYIYGLPLSDICKFYF